MKDYFKEPRYTPAGGEITVDAEKRSDEELLGICAVAAETGGRILIGNIHHKEPIFLKRLATIGKGNILFDLR